MPGHIEHGSGLLEVVPALFFVKAFHSIQYIYRIFIQQFLLIQEPDQIIQKTDDPFLFDRCGCRKRENQQADCRQYHGHYSFRRVGIERQTAHNVDCFTTVSDITARECVELLDKPVDVVLPNGFEDNFVPKGATFTRKRKAARRRLLNIANALMGTDLDDDTLIVSTSGRYEFRNKGIDVFIEAMNRLLRDRNLNKKVLAFIVVPGWVGEPRQDLQQKLAEEQLQEKTPKGKPLEVPMITHWLHNMGHDNVLNMMKFYDMHNREEDRVKLVFLPCYLTGNDGIINMTYYDVVLGNDLCIYPSYYEPWGYTPLEAVAFHVPCITTDLAGFGLWVNKVLGHPGEIQDGVKVIRRTDYNYSEVADIIKETVADFSNMTADEVKKARKQAEQISKKALWSHFIKYYYEAYDVALRKAQGRDALML